MLLCYLYIALCAFMRPPLWSIALKYHSNFSVFKVHADLSPGNDLTSILFAITFRYIDVVLWPIEIYSCLVLLGILKTTNRVVT